uniref:FRAS1-related extracellular matrix protein 1-like n=1 Tax=Gouania willdenowi TaxID=441366 RepID=A0A8C5DE64_GOUWI
PDTPGAPGGPGAHAAFVHVRESLKVKRGQWAYLQPQHLHFLVPQQKDSCKLEVVLNEPITQRVGELMPQVFDCSYLSEEVKYVHNGCPLLKKDEVKLRLYWFTETNTYTEVISLHVDIVEADCSVIRLGPKALSVPHFYGVSNAIDGDVVSFHYERRPSVECSVHLNTHGSQLPAHGQVVTGEPEVVLKRGDEPESFIHLPRAKCSSDDCLKGLKMVTFTKVSCDDFLMMGLRYHHTEPPSPNVDYITISLHLKDTKSGTIYQTEGAWVPVQIMGAIPNQPPRPSFSSMFLLEVDQFILTPLSTATLDADDEENPKELLVFNITRPPMEGFITHLSDHTHPITSFTWTDLNHMLIGYQPPNSSHDQRHSYQAELEVHDLFFEKSSKITVHMSVRNSDTHAPRVSWNMGLSLLEGQSRPITWEQLQVVDDDNLNAVRIIIIDGLHHGHITVKEGRSFMFSISDITAGLVCYHHDDSDSTKDFVIFRITDGRHQTRHKFPIKILPKDDSPPFLITNMLLEVPEGSTALLRGSILQASDMDSSDDYVMFNITRPPRAGHLIKVPGPGLMGYSITSFQQRELSHSTIYYQHHHNQALEDSFEVVLSDSHQPPNLSQPQVVMVHIEPVPDQPPVEVSTSSRCIIVKETDVVHITRKHLHFIDKHSVDSELTYNVTTPPFFTSHTRSVCRHDAGRLFLVDSVPTLTKDPSTAALMIFTQHAVNFLKVAYMPPVLDIGPHPQEVQLVLSVTNQHGQSVTGLCLNITVLPVDNQPPQVVFQPLSVDEGGATWIDWDHLLLSDVDSVEHALRVELRGEPRHGAVWLGGLTLKVGQTFTVQDLRVPNIRYIHDGSETTDDSIELSTNDGTNAVHFILPVKVFPVNDEVPVLAAGLKPVLTCPEGQEVVISPDYVYATDADSEEDELVFLIARQPNHGTVLRHGLEVDRFVQGDVRAGIISYRHTGEEVGLSLSYDIVTLVISDEDCCGDVELRRNLPVYDLHITVVPVDNQTPEIATGDVFKVDEGGVALITASHLKALDSDTEWENLTISVTSTPQYGYVENVLPFPGSEKSNVGQSITTFSYQDVMEGNIRYVQSRHQGLEPTADHFLLRVSDGKHSSTQVPFYVIIVPSNDETPRFTANNVTVLEGERVQLDSSVFYADDDDVPEDVLLLSVIEPPQHGTIVITENNSSISDGLHFTMTDLDNGLMLTYTHDDSEMMKDIFTVQLTDGKHTVIRYVGITVENDGVDVDVGETRLISSLSLFARDVDTLSSQIYYVLETLPRHGRLEVKEGDEWVNLSSGTNVTQEAVNMNHVRYVHTNRLTSEKKDVFVFHLNDGVNRSPSQYFTMSLKDVGEGRCLL